MTMRLAQTETLAGVGAAAYRTIQGDAERWDGATIRFLCFPLRSHLASFLVPALNLAASRPLIVMLVFRLFFSLKKKKKKVGGGGGRG